MNTTSTEKNHIYLKMMLQKAKGLDTIPDNKDIFKRMQQIVR